MPLGILCLSIIRFWFLKFTSALMLELPPATSPFFCFLPCSLLSLNGHEGSVCVPLQLSGLLPVCFSVFYSQEDEFMPHCSPWEGCLGNKTEGVCPVPRCVG